jgi:hypothetical protein
MQRQMKTALHYVRVVESRAHGTSQTSGGNLARRVIQKWFYLEFESRTDRTWVRHISVRLRRLRVLRETKQIRALVINSSAKFGQAVCVCELPIRNFLFQLSDNI